MHPFNQELKNYFRDNGIRLKEVSNLLNIKQSTLSERLKSDRCLSVESFLILAKAYGYEIIELASEYFGFTPMYKHEIDEINELWEKVHDSIDNIKRYHSDITKYIKRIDELYEKYHELKR